MKAYGTVKNYSDSQHLSWFYAIQNFTNVFIKVCFMILSWSRWTLVTISHHTSLFISQYVKWRLPLRSSGHTFCIWLLYVSYRVSVPNKTYCRTVSRCITCIFFVIVIFTIKQLFVVNYNICIQVTSKLFGQCIYTHLIFHGLMAGP